MIELKIEDLYKKYGKKTALKNFSYTFVSGIYGLIGPNGAGKSTLMNIMRCSAVFIREPESRLWHFPETGNRRRKRYGSKNNTGGNFNFQYGDPFSGICARKQEREKF